MKIETDKPAVPQWFDEWYRSMKYAGDRDTFILKVMFSVNHYGRYDDYRRDNGFFDKDQFTYISDNFMKVINAIQFGYEVEQEPRHYAKIKGWEHIGTTSYYFGYDEDNDSLEVTYLESNYSFAFSLTKEHWDKLGINDTNADFVEVE